MLNPNSNNIQLEQMNQILTNIKNKVEANPEFATTYIDACMDTLSALSDGKPTICDSVHVRDLNQKALLG